MDNAIKRLARMAKPTVHQKLTDGLTYHVIRGEMDRDEAEHIINFYDEQHPDSDFLDDAVLWQIRKDYGLEAPNV